MTFCRKGNCTVKQAPCSSLEHLQKPVVLQPSEKYSIQCIFAFFSFWYVKKKLYLVLGFSLKMGSKQKKKLSFEDWNTSCVVCLWGWHLKTQTKLLLLRRTTRQNCTATTFSHFQAAKMIQENDRYFCSVLQKLQVFCQPDILSNVISRIGMCERIFLSTRKSCRKSLIGTSIVSKMDTKLISLTEEEW